MKKFTVTVGIPAHNEEANIAELLRRVFGQHEEEFLLKRVIVVADGCSDMTVEKVKSLRDDRLLLVVNKNRVGQSVSQNIIFSMSKSDVVLLLEADTLPSDNSVFKQLIQAYKKRQKKDVMIVGSPNPSQQDSFYEKIQCSGYSAKIKFFSAWKNGKNLYTCTGHAGRLFSGAFVRTFRWPLDVPEDAYLYFFLKQNKLSFRTARHAIINLRCVSTIKDRGTQLTKFRSGESRLSDFFPSGLLNKEYRLTLKTCMELIIYGVRLHKLWFIAYLLDFLILRLITSNYGAYTQFHPTYLSTKNVAQKSLAT